MAIIGIGTDIIEIERFGRIQKAAGETFLRRNFTDDENELFTLRKMKDETIAANFAAKEAVVKALGTGFTGVNPKDVEILRDTNGKPYVNLYDTAKTVADALGVIRTHVTISHSKKYATAFVVMER